MSWENTIEELERQIKEFKKENKRLSQELEILRNANVSLATSKHCPVCDSPLVNNQEEKAVAAAKRPRGRPKKK